MVIDPFGVVYMRAEPRECSPCDKTVSRQTYLRCTLDRVPDRATPRGHRGNGPQLFRTDSGRKFCSIYASSRLHRATHMSTKCTIAYGHEVLDDDHVCLELADTQDDELVAMVHGKVDQRIAEYRQVARDHPERAAFASVIGCLPYGMAGTPRIDHIRKGLEYFRRERQRQREVRARIAAARKALPTSGVPKATG